MTMETKSIWSGCEIATPGARLPMSCDVCVVGAGIAGLTTAYHLATGGRRVVVLEAGPRPGGGETAFTTAHLASVIDDRFDRLRSIRGIDAARLAHQSHASAIDEIERIAGVEGIDCDFERVDGFLFASAKEGIKVLEEEEETLREAGIPYFRMEKSPLPPHGFLPALRFGRQARFHPLKYLAGLVRALAPRCDIVTDARVTELNREGDVWQVHCGDRRLTAKVVVLATNTPLNGGIGVNSRIAAYTTYALSAAVPVGSVPNALYWDTEDPYHYIRTARFEGGERLIVGGEDAKTGQAHDPLERWARLEQWAREWIPGMETVERRWSGQVFETLDGLALIGRAPGGDEDLYVITGDSGMGLTHGTIAGLLIPKLIAGETHPWAGLYDPSRKPLAAIGTFVKENANVAGQYRDWLVGADVDSPTEVKQGCGGILRRGLSLIACYRDETGKVHERSATCPHMMGVVRWNASAGTWDCPCHGSRFGPTGKLLHGPATSDLAEVEPEAAATALEASVGSPMPAFSGL